MTKSDKWEATRVDVRLKDRACAECGIIIPMLASRKYCKKCSSIKKSENAKRAWRLGNLKKIKPKPNIKCVICEKSFTGHPNKKTCSIECRNERDRLYVLKFSRSKEGVEKARRTLLQKKYGITLEDKEAMIASQGGKCLICTSDLDCFTHSHVDHDHKTGKVRGILCRFCNLGLGAFKDKIDSLKSAINYLSNHANL